MSQKPQIVPSMEFVKLKRVEITKFTKTLLQVVVIKGHTACNLLHQMSHFLLQIALASAKEISCPEDRTKALSWNVDIDLQYIQCKIPKYCRPIYSGRQRVNYSTILLYALFLRCFSNAQNLVSFSIWSKILTLRPIIYLYCPPWKLSVFIALFLRHKNIYFFIYFLLRSVKGLWSFQILNF